MLSTAELQRFVGGQLEIQNRMEDYLFRGEVATVAVVGEDLRVTFAWLAKMTVSFSRPENWVLDERTVYAVNITVCTPSNIGPGSEGSDRLCINVSNGETLIFFPPDGSKLDPKDVIGLGLLQAAPATT